MKFWSRPATLAGIAESGAFHVLYAEEVIGAVEFVWSPDGTYEGSSAITVAGQTARSRIHITSNRKGHWIQAVIKSDLGTTTITREGRKVVWQYNEQKVKTKVPRDTLIYDPGAPALLRLLLARFGGRRSKPLKIPVLSFSAGFNYATVERDRGNSS